MTTVPIASWFLKYITRAEEKPQFYASYGSFMHKLLEQYYKGEATKEQVQTKFLLDFSKEVQGERPQESTVRKYIQQGCAYLKSLEPLPYKPIGIEKKVVFQLNGVPFVGYIDYLGEQDGELVIVDNKSRALKPRSGRKKPTKGDAELDEMLRQLYLYAGAVHQEYGRFPSKLCFNCFREQRLIEEPFLVSAYEEAVSWALRSIEYIKETEDFHPYIEYFSCRYICGVCD